MEEELIISNKDNLGKQGFAREVLPLFITI